MLADSYRTRGATFAFLIGPPRSLTRQHGTRIHSAVCDALGADDIAFQFQGSEHSTGGGRGFSIHLQRQEGRENMVIEISSSAQNAPTRLLLRYDWPASNQLVFDDFDLASEAVLSSLGEGWQRILAEARVQGQIDVPTASAVSFLTNGLFRFPGRAEGAQDELSFLGFKYETTPGDFAEEDQLANPKRDVSVEVLREDPRCLYLEVMSQWPQLSVSPDGTVELSPGRIRAFRSPPSEYLRDTIEYVDTAVLPLLLRA